MNEPFGACWLCGGRQPWTKGVGLCPACWRRWSDEAHYRSAVTAPVVRWPDDGDDPTGYTPPPEYGNPVG